MILSVYVSWLDYTDLADGFGIAADAFQPARVVCIS
jgi:hypothetical protein